MADTVYYRFVVRSYTAAEFAAMNDILLERELGVELDTGRMKRGDGSTPWNDKGYEILGLGNIDFTSLANGASLYYNATTGGFEAKPQQVSATKRVLGRNSTGAGAVEEVTLSQLLDWSGTAADGDILYRSGGAWTRLPKGTDGQVLTLASGVPSWAGAGSGAWALVKKTADESRNTTATLADDGALKIALAASTLYHFRAKIFVVIPNSTAGFKYGFAYSGTTTTVRSYRHTTPATTTAQTTIGADFSSATLPSGTGTFSDAGTVGVAYLEMVFSIRTNSGGTLSLQWAQSTSNAGNTTVCEGSCLEYAAF